jgi:hypothetical protein
LPSEDIAFLVPIAAVNFPRSFATSLSEIIACSQSSKQWEVNASLVLAAQCSADELEFWPVNFFQQ